MYAVFSKSSMKKLLFDKPGAEMRESVLRSFERMLLSLTVIVHNKCGALGLEQFKVSQTEQIQSSSSPSCVSDI